MGGKSEESSSSFISFVTMVIVLSLIEIVICPYTGKESSDSSSSSPSLWLAPDPSKRWGEIFFLCYTPFWLTLCLGIVIPCKLYEVINLAPLVLLLDLERIIGNCSLRQF